MVACSGSKAGALRRRFDHEPDRVADGHNARFDQQPGAVGQHGIGHAADPCGNARQPSGRGLQIDEAKSFDAA